MWRWPSMPIMLAQTRSFIRLLGWASLITATSLCYAAPTSLGPTSPEEAKLLWQDGQLSSRESRFQDTVNLLGRYVDRYPGAPGFLEAHFLLGKAYFELKRPQEALKVLQYYVNSKGMTLAAAEARVWEGRSYLELGKFHEALQVTLELQQAQLPLEMNLWKLWIQARAWVNLGHESQASTAIEVAEHALSTTTPRQMRGQIYALKLQIKAMSCAHLQSSLPLDETQALSLMDRRGTCLLETSLIFHQVLKTEDALAATEAALQLKRAFEAYRIACHRAPPPKPIPGHTRTPKEFKSYRAELRDLLLNNYFANLRRALDLLNSWSPSPTSPVYNSYLLVSNYMKKPTVRTPSVL